MSGLRRHFPWRIALVSVLGMNGLASNSMAAEYSIPSVKDAEIRLDRSVEETFNTLTFARSSLDKRGVKSDRLSEPEQDIRAAYLERKRVRQAAAAGCIGGAIGGMIIGAVLGNNTGDKKVETKEVLLAGVAGCAAGAAIGSARGRYVHAKTQEYQNSQVAELKLIEALDQDVSYFRIMNGHTQRLIASEKTKVQQLNAELAANKITAKGYRKSISGNRGNLKALGKTIEDNSQNIQLVNVDIATLRSQGVSTIKFDTRVAQLQETRERLMAQRTELKNVYASIPPEVSKRNS